MTVQFGKKSAIGFDSNAFDSPLGVALSRVAVFIGSNFGPLLLSPLLREESVL
jgi:hypothetical protein